MRLAWAEVDIEAGNGNSSDGDDTEKWALSRLGLASQKGYELRDTGAFGVPAASSPTIHSPILRSRSMCGVTTAYQPQEYSREKTLFSENL